MFENSKKWPTVLRSVQIKENLTSNVSGNKNRVFPFFRKKCAKNKAFPMKIKIFKNSQNFFGNCFRDSYHIFLFKNKKRISFTSNYNIFEMLQKYLFFYFLPCPESVEVLHLI